MANVSFTALSLTLATLSSIAKAHGGPPAIESVIASDSDGPWLAELSEGFALRDHDGAWSFLCPAAFAADTPPHSAAAGEVVWISGGMDLFQLTAQRALLATDQPAFASSRVLALGTVGTALVALRVATPGTELVRVEGETEERVFADPSTFWNVLAVRPAGSGGDAVFWLARIDGQSFELLGLSGAGDEVARATTPWPSMLLSLRLTAAGEDVFVHAYDNLGYSLVHAAAGDAALTEGAVVAEARVPMRGPVMLGGELLFTRDDQLMVYSEGAAEPSDSVLGSEPLSCLAPPYVCTPSRLYAIDTVEAAGRFEPGDALLDLARLGQPSLRPDDAELSEYCSAQWLVFQGDLERAGIAAGDGGVPIGDGGPADAGDDASLAADASAPATSSSSSCSAGARGYAHGAAQLMSLGLGAMAIYVRRRRAQCRSRL